MVQFYVDAVNKRAFWGWAHIPGSERRVSLKVYADSELVHIITACQPRQDLVTPLNLKGPYHAFSGQVPFNLRVGGGTLIVVACGDGFEQTVLTHHFDPDPALFKLSNGILTVYFDRDAGGIICGIQSVDFPHVQNFIDGGEAYGRGLQADIGNYLTSFNPTEGGGISQGAPVNGPVLLPNVPFAAYSSVRMINWVDNTDTEIYLTRLTQLVGRMLVTKYTLTNKYPDPIIDYVSADLYLDPQYLSQFDIPGDFDPEDINPALVQTNKGIGVIYNQNEGKDSYALAFGSKFGSAAKRDLVIDVDDTMSSAFPPSFFVGNRTEPFTLAPGDVFFGELAVVIEQGCPKARAAIQDWEQQP